jgi:hypothetical protein
VTDRHQYVGIGQPDTLLTAIGSLDGTLSGTALTGWPTSGNPFVICLGRGGPTEERILCASRSGTTLMVAPGGRGFDGTASQSHAPGEPLVLFAPAAVEMDQLNAHGSVTTLDEHTQYLQTGGLRHDLAVRHAIGTTFPAPAAPGNSAPGDTAAKGVSTGPARADHLHGREATVPTHDFRLHWFGPVTTLALSTSTVWFVPFRVYAPVTLSQVQVNITFAATVGSSLQTAFFADAGNQPAASAFNAGGQAADTSTGILTLTFTPVLLGVGLWWVAIGTVGTGSPVVTGTNANVASVAVVSPFGSVPSNPVLSGPGFAASGSISSFGGLGTSDVPLVFGIQ